MRKSIIYKLKATVRDFVTFEKLSINNIHFGFNQSSYYYLMGKNSSVNGEVMFKFDASKYDIKDGNVTFWVWSPDIPSLGSIPKPINLTQGSSQGNTGNVPKIGYSESLGRRANLYKPDVGVTQIPYITISVTIIKALKISITVKLFDTKSQPIPNKKINLTISFHPSVPREYIQDEMRYIFNMKNYIINHKDLPMKIKDWTIDTLMRITDILPTLFKFSVTNRTNNNGEFRYTFITIIPYITGRLEIYASLDETWSQGNPPLTLQPGTIYASVTIPIVSKRVTILTDVSKILEHPYYKAEFTRILENVEYQPTGKGSIKIETFRVFAEIGKRDFYTKSLKERYIGFYFKMKLGPDDKAKDIYQLTWNYFTDLNGDGSKNALSNLFKIYNKKLEDELVAVYTEPALRNLADGNQFGRVAFKWVWQFVYPSWSFKTAQEMYKDNILSLSYRSPEKVGLLILSTFGHLPTSLQTFVFTNLRLAYIISAISSPAVLYSLTLSTGDYKYMLAAIDGSIRSILGSILIGLAEVKAETKSFIENWYKYIPIAQTIISAILSIILIKSLLAAIIIAIIAVVLVVLQILEFNHLKDNTYSPQFLRELVKLTEYDLTLLNYEVSIWEQLQD